MSSLRFCMLFLAVVGALGSMSRPAAAHENKAARKVMRAGLITFGVGYSLYAMHPLTCFSDSRSKSSCVGSAKMLVPFAGYALYRADAARRHEAEVEAEIRARGDGCMNSAIGCGLADAVRAMAWIPTGVQIVGAVLAVGGALGVASASSSPPALPQASWTITPSVTSHQAGIEMVGRF